MTLNPYSPYDQNVPFSFEEEVLTTKKEVRLLLDATVDSFILSTERISRSWDHGRNNAVLMPLDHPLEMFLKAAIFHAEELAISSSDLMLALIWPAQPVPVDR